MCFSFTVLPVKVAEEPLWFFFPLAAMYEGVWLSSLLFLELAKFIELELITMFFFLASAAVAVYPPSKADFLSGLWLPAFEELAWLILESLRFYYGWVFFCKFRAEESLSMRESLLAVLGLFLFDYYLIVCSTSLLSKPDFWVLYMVPPRLLGSFDFWGCRDSEDFTWEIGAVCYLDTWRPDVWSILEVPFSLESRTQLF